MSTSSETSDRKVRARDHVVATSDESDAAASDRQLTTNETYRLPTVSVMQMPTLEAIVGPRYRVIRELGRGGMGVVYLAYDRRLEREVAIKVLLGGPFASHGDRARFHAEAVIVAQLRHPNIVQVFEAGEANEYQYLILEYVAGASLKDRLKHGPFAAADAAHLVAAVARAVQYAHDHGIVHRDLKPHNVLLSGDPAVPKLTDFGVAKRVDQASDLTRTGLTIGTPAYMAPEQAIADDAAVGPRADVYSLGVVLAELLTGRHPYRDDAFRKKSDPEPSFPAAVPRPLVAICRRCLEWQPDQRYASASALAAALDTWESHPVVEEPKPRRRRWWPMATAVAVAVLFAASAIPFLLGRPKPAVAGTPLTAVEERLARGEKATLIGPTGLPGEFRWAVGPSALTKSQLVADDTCSFQASGYSLLELVADPQTDRYRFTAQLRHDGVLPNFKRGQSGEEMAQVGVYFGFGRTRAPAACDVERLVIAHFNEARADADLIRLPSVNRAGCDFLTHYRDELGKSRAEHGTLGGCEFESMLVLGSTWRTIAVDVHPDGFRAYWMENGRATLMGEAAAADLNASYGTWPPPARQFVGTKPSTVLAWNARSPVGIYARGAAVSVRNVKLEPLNKR